jgi:hypothetical protein
MTQEKSVDASREKTEQSTELCLQRECKWKTGGESREHRANSTSTHTERVYIAQLLLYEKLYTMISLCVIPNLKCNSWKEYAYCIVTSLLLDSTYIVPMVVSYMEAH